MLAANRAGGPSPDTSSEPSMPTTILTDLDRDIWAEGFALHAEDVGGAPPNGR